MYPRAADLLSFCEAHYLYPLRRLAGRPPHLHVFLSYHALLADLPQTVLQALDRLYPVPAAAEGEEQRVEGARDSTRGDSDTTALHAYLREEQSKASELPPLINVCPHPYCCVSQVGTAARTCTRWRCAAGA